MTAHRRPTLSTRSWLRRVAVLAMLALVQGLVVPTAAQAAGQVSASVSIPAAAYDGSGRCADVPVTLYVSGGVSNGFAYWTTENETLSGPTSSPSPASFFFDNEEAPGRDSIYMCPSTDHAGVYTYSADVWFHNYSSEGGDEYAGRVTARFVMGLARSTIVKKRKHRWQVKVVDQPYLVSYPTVVLQKRVGARWRKVARGTGDSAGTIALRPGPRGRYRLLYRTDADQGLEGSTSKVFARP